MGKSRPPYPDAFRTEAVELVRRSGIRLRLTPVAVIARDLGICGETLRLWVRTAERPGQPTAGQGLAESEREELRRLRREVQVLQQERDSLKKAAAFFAKETL